MNRSYIMPLLSLVVGVLLAGSVQAEEIFLDNFQQFPSGTVLSETNYLPAIGVSASIQTNENAGQNSTAVTASNFLGSTRAFFDLGTVPYKASYLGSPVGGAQTNQVLTLKFLLWTQALTNPAHFGGISLRGLATNLDVQCTLTDCSTNGLGANSLVLLNDGGQVFTFTNVPSLETAVAIGSWSNLVGQLTTNALVVNYPAGTFSFSINGTVLTNLPIPSYFTNVYDMVRVDVEENITNSGVASLGNRFALDDIQLLNALPATNQDVTFYVAADKGQFFQQISTNPPSLVATGFTFQAMVLGSGSNVLVSGKDQIPSGTNLTLTATDSSSNSLSFEQDFASQTALDSVYSNGIYTLSILTTNQGSFSPSLILPANAYPTNAPQIINFAAAQMVDASTNFVLVWSPFVDGTNTDLISVSLTDTNGVNVFETPNLGQTGQLSAAATSVVISGGVLQAGETYTGTVAFVKITDSDTNSIPGATGVTAYFKQTDFTLTTLPPPCSFVLGQSNLTISAAGGSSNLVFTANGTNCAWTAVSNDSFVTITSATNGVGSGSISFTVSANTNTTAQIGTITVGEQMFTITEAGAIPCSFTLSASCFSLGVAGGSSNVNLIASGSNCVWTAVSNNSFISITSATNGSGSASVSFTVSANTNTTAQIGTLTIGGQTFTVTEAAVVPCSFTLNTSSANLGSGGGSSNITFTASGTNCVWTAVSNNGFITITSATNGVGSGSVSFTVNANTNTTAQIGTLTIGGQTFTVTEAGVPPCSFTLSASSASFSPVGGTSNVNVIASASNCVWTAVSNDGFITIVSLTNTIGSGSVQYTVLSNTTLNARTGTVTIAANTFTVIQAGEQAVVDLTITSSNTPNPVFVGSNLTYTITVNNAGTNAANGIVVVDALPTNETFVSAISSQGTFTESAGFVTNTIGTLPAGSNAVLTIVITPIESTLAMITNTATVSTSASDTNTANNSTTNITTVGVLPGVGAGLTILESVSPTPILVNTHFTYTLTVTNAGPNQAISVVVTDQLPADVTVLSTAATTGTATNSGSLVTANLGNLSSGAVAQVSILVNPTNFGILTNTATVGAGTTNLNPTGSSVTLTTPIFTVDFLTVTKLTAPKKITLTSKHTNVLAKISVVIENTGSETQTIPLDALSNLVTVAISSANCLPPTTQVVLPKKDKPIVLAPKKSLTVQLTAEFTCADTYTYTAAVHHSALDGSPDGQLPNDVCPRPANPAIGDKGCGNKDATTKQIGAPVTTVVTMKP